MPGAAAIRCWGRCADSMIGLVASEGGPKIKPGDVVGGKYRVDGVLGEGGMGVVLSAYQIDLARSVALKLMSASALAHPGARARFLREARASAAIESDHAVRVLDTGELDGGVPYMTMERLDGVDLARALKVLGVFAVDVAVRCVLEAASAIGEAHARGIVHRDLKPSNLFVARRFDGQERIVVLDFGISKAVSGEGSLDLTATTDTMGSPFYMSPEQVRSMKSVDGRTDVWALGIVLYELLVGRPPWNAPSVTAVAAMIVADAAAPPRTLREEIPAELDAAILRCLEKRPEDRFASIAELRRALAPFGTSEPLAVLHAVRAAGTEEDAPDSRAATELAVVTDDDRARRAETTEPRAAERRSRLPRAPLFFAGGLVFAALASVVGFRAVTTDRHAGGAPMVQDPRPVPVMSAPCVETGHRTYRRLLGPTSSSLSVVGDHALLAQNGPTIGRNAQPVYLDLSLPLRPETTFQWFKLPFDIPGASISVASAPLGHDVGVVASIGGGASANTRFTSLALDASGAPSLGRNGRAVPHESYLFAAGTARESGITMTVSAGTRLVDFHDGGRRGAEIRVVALGDASVDVSIPLAQGADFVAAADGKTRAHAVYRSRGVAYGMALSPTMTPLDGNIRLAELPERIVPWVGTLPDDRGLFAWRTSDGLALRTLDHDGSLSPESRITLDAPRGMAFGVTGARGALAWVDSSGQGHYGFIDPDLEGAVRQAYPVKVTPPVTAVAVSNDNMWIVSGDDVLEVVSLRCSQK